MLLGVNIVGPQLYFTRFGLVVRKICLFKVLLGFLGNHNVTYLLRRNRLSVPETDLTGRFLGVENVGLALCFVENGYVCAKFSLD